MNYVMTTCLKLLKKLFDFFTTYYFLVDLYLLEYFSRKYPYCIFIFCFFYGTFGYSDGLTELQFLGKFVCLLFSWYLIYTSITVFCVFNISVTKEYLYNLLGKEFVVSKIGNLGLDALARFGGFAALGLAINEAGRLGDRYVIVGNATTALNIQLDAINKDPNLSVKQKAVAVEKALQSYRQMVKTPAQGTLDRTIKVEPYRGMMDSGLKAFKSIFGK